MEKSVFDQFVQNLESAEIIEKLHIRFEGGNRVVSKDSAYIKIQDESIIAIETDSNYVGKNFNIKNIPFDNIDNIGAFGLTTQEVLKFCEVAGIEVDDELKEFIKKKGGKISIKPSNGNVKFDTEGNEIIDTLQYPRINK